QTPEEQNDTMDQMPKEDNPQKTESEKVKELEDKVKKLECDEHQVKLAEVNLRNLDFWADKSKSEDTPFYFPGYPSGVTEEKLRETFTKRLDEAKAKCE